MAGRVVLGLATVLAVGAVVFAITGMSSRVVAVHVTRDPGTLALSALDRTVSNQTDVDQLVTDIHALPRFPAEPILCPADFGTKYTLDFNDESGKTVWVAIIEAAGCQRVVLNDGRILWAAKSPSLFVHLGSALGLSQSELLPRP
jgi:hypothetical protein